MEKDAIISALKSVIDPELGIDIWTMGLVYDIQVRDESIVDILMTLTTPFCPMAPYIQDQVRIELERVGARDVNITLTFDPPWKPTEELRALLGV